MQKSEPRQTAAQGFVKLMRSPDVEELIEAAPFAFVLATVIGLRARYKPGLSLKGLERGECYLGDFKRYGMSRQQYRHALKQLTDWKFISQKATNKGTVARLINTRLFDVSGESVQPTSNQQATSKQPLSKKGKKDKKERNPKTAGAASKFALPATGELFRFAEETNLGRDVVLRWLRYIETTGTPPHTSWRAALRAFAATCADSPHGAGTVPDGWQPTLADTYDDDTAKHSD